MTSSWCAESTHAHPQSPRCDRGCIQTYRIAGLFHSFAKFVDLLLCTKMKSTKYANANDL